MKSKIKIKKTDNSCFYIRLLDLINLTGINQLELSNRSGLTQAAISQFVSGKREPSLSSILKIDLGLGGVDLNYLIKGIASKKCYDCDRMKQKILEVINDI